MFVDMLEMDLNTHNNPYKFKEDTPLNSSISWSTRDIFVEQK